ncbi:hypothetical protein CR513_14708, partial [Mucuna pruriens]
MKIKSTYRKSFMGDSGWKGKDKEKDGLEERKALKGEEAITIPIPIPLKSSTIKCFKCLGKGHITSQPPNKRVMIMKEYMESSLGEATISNEAETLSDDFHYEGDLLVVKQLMNSHMGEEAKI